MAIQLKKILASKVAKKVYFFFALLLVLFFVCNDLIIPWYVNQGGVVTVPSVVGKTFDEAKTALDSAGLEARKGDVRTDRTRPAGIVIIQNPLPNHEVKRGRRVYLTISGGEQMVTVPNLKGRTLRDARFALEREGLKLGGIEYQPSEQFPANTIIGQKPSAEAKVKRDVYVSVVISQGQPNREVSVPDVVGLTLTEAQEMLGASRLKVGNITYAAATDVLPNTVLEQFPRKGEIVQFGQQVDLVVVKGGEKKKDIFEY